MVDSESDTRKSLQKEDNPRWSVPNEILRYFLDTSKLYR